MGNNQSFEISPEELERFEMEVDDDYNPIDAQGIKQARLKYRLRKGIKDSKLFLQHEVGGGYGNE